MPADVVGVGYEGLDADGLSSILRLRGVKLVVDVRLTPISRKRGFSKKALSTWLPLEGIVYEHLPALGNPTDNRKAFARTTGPDAANARDRFDEILKSAQAQTALARVRLLARQGRVGLLCFERDETRCHRELILRAL